MKKVEQYQETETKLMQAYEKLLLDQSKISVDKICGEANLHHQTFYRHFDNKEEFFEFYINKKINEVIEGTKTLSTQNFAANLLERAYNNPKLVKIYLADSKARQIIVDKLSRQMGIKIAKEFSIQKSEELFFLIGGLLYYIVQCISHDDVISLDEAKNNLKNIFLKIKVLK